MTAAVTAPMRAHRLHGNPLKVPAVAKYLSIYAESEAQSLMDLGDLQVRHCLVVPCCDEAPGFFEKLIRQPLWRQRLLAIVVINQPDNIDAYGRNRSLAEYFQKFDLLCSDSHLNLYRHEESFFLVVRRYEEGLQLPAAEGVGLARKIGFDLAAQMYARQHLHSPWIYSCDADAQLPDNYLLDRVETSGAITFGFIHEIRQGSGEVAAEVPQELLPALAQATQIYEDAILYYQRCLQWAGSAFAYTSLGSALAVHAQTYCQVRGFPRRSGGEDFYLLNKIAKIAPVTHDSRITIRLAARKSARVPFGTGPAVSRIMELADPVREFCYYHTACFQHLRQFLDIAAHTLPDATPTTSLWTDLPSETTLALESIGLKRFQEHLHKQVRTETQYHLAFRQWFDAFNTLKFIKVLQKFYPPLPLQDCLQNAPYKNQTSL